MQSTGGRLRGQGNLWDWIRSKMERHILLYTGEYRIVCKTYSAYRWRAGNNRTTRGSVVSSGGEAVP